MMRTIYFILACALFTLGGCSDNSEKISEFQKPFLGQWKEIARGNGMHPVLEPDGHTIEFLLDGTFHRYGSARRYRVDAEFLYLDSGKSPDGHTDRYTFTGTDTLRLDYVDGNIEESSTTPHFNIYERLITIEQ
jgi:hypothetical protein